MPNLDLDAEDGWGCSECGTIVCRMPEVSRRLASRNLPVEDDRVICLECFTSGDETLLGPGKPKNLACYVEEDDVSPNFLYLCSDCDRKVYEKQREQFDDEDFKKSADVCWSCWLDRVERATTFEDEEAMEATRTITITAEDFIDFFAEYFPNRVRVAARKLAEEEEYVELQLYFPKNYDDSRGWMSCFAFSVITEKLVSPSSSTAIVKFLYNTSSPFAAWLCNFDDDDYYHDEEDVDGDLSEQGVSCGSPVAS